ncbi:MAG: SprT family zinc-dependent metalloprotease [Candidatus Paceibacterota bacterium]|jgi:hypothetical protein
MNSEEKSLPFQYELVRSRRARHLRITIYRNDGRVRVSAPFLAPNFLIERFVNSKQSWVLGKREKFLKNPPAVWNVKPANGWRKDYLAKKSAALKLVKEKLAHFGNIYNSTRSDCYHFKWGKISIRNQSSRWGSCSAKGNLNFSYRIIYLPPRLQDYIIVHELCHLAEFNHSKKFWELVGREVGDYKVLRKRLRGGIE